MKHLFLVTTLLLAAGWQTALHAVEQPYDYIFFENSLIKGGYFYSAARYVSPSWIKHSRRSAPRHPRRRRTHPLPGRHRTAASALQTPGQPAAKAYERHIDLRWTPRHTGEIKYYRIYRSFDGTNYRPVAIRRPGMNRYADFLGQTGRTAYYKITAVDYTLNESEASDVVSATTSPMTDEQLLDLVQEAHFRYYWEGAEPHSGLAPERIHIDGVYPEHDADIVTTGGSGVGIAGLLVEIERGFITRGEGLERLLKIVGFLEKADRFHGVWPHWLHGPSGKVKPFGQKDNGGDLVESAFLMQGLLAARQYFRQGNAAEKQLAGRIDRLWREIPRLQHEIFKPFK